jgi:hypothetical protein
MKAGDLVRFRECVWHVEPKRYTEWKVGLLLKYIPWMKIATILYEGEEYTVRAENTQLHKRAKRN